MTDMTFNILQEGKIDISSPDSKGYGYIYIGYDEHGKVCYVGQTLKLISRIQAHARKWKTYKYYVVDIKDLNLAEKYFTELEMPGKRHRNFKNRTRNMNPLKRWLFENKISQKKFAEIIDYQYTYVSNCINDYICPGRKFIKKVEKATLGQVSAKDWVKVKKENADQMDLFDKTDRDEKGKFVRKKA